jgi:kinesin family protein 4/21/27
MQRPKSAMIRPASRPRSASRMSTSSKTGAGTRYSDEDGKTAVKVGITRLRPLPPPC